MIIRKKLGECDVLNDVTISFDAKGLYCSIKFYLDTEKNDITKELLMNSCKDAEENFDSAWLELVNKGYLIKHVTKNEYQLLINKSI